MMCACRCDLFDLGWRQDGPIELLTSREARVPDARIAYDDLGPNSAIEYALHPPNRPHHDRTCPALLDQRRDPLVDISGLDPPHPYGSEPWLDPQPPCGL